MAGVRKDARIPSTRRLINLDGPKKKILLHSPEAKTMQFLIIEFDLTRLPTSIRKILINHLDEEKNSKKKQQNKTNKEERARVKDR